MASKSYQEHLRNAQYCSLRWRILTLKPGYNERYNSTLPKFRVIPVRCNSKACPRCARLKFNQLRNSIRDVSKFYNWRFFTLTLRKGTTTQAADLEHLENSFRQLRKKLKRKFPELKYIAIKELSPSGMWHFHGLWNIYIDVQTLSNYWEEISGSFVVYLEKVRSPRGCVNYIFKYCYKSVFNETERRLLYENNYKKFTSSKGLLSSNKNENPYSAELGVDYNVEELKERIFEIVRTSDLTVNDFYSDSYPYFEDLIQNCFAEHYCNSPPDLFYPDPTEKILV